MSAHTPQDEFDAARALVDVLRALQPEEQARAIRWAQEKLGVIGLPSAPVTGGGGVVGIPPAGRSSAGGGHELTAALNDPEFRRLRSAVDKMLYLLGAAYRLRPEAFE